MDGLGWHVSHFPDEDRGKSSSVSFAGLMQIMVCYARFVVMDIHSFHAVGVSKMGNELRSHCRSPIVYCSFSPAHVRRRLYLIVDATDEEPIVRLKRNIAPKPCTPLLRYSRLVLAN